MKELITDALNKKLMAALEATGGVRALYGDPIVFQGEEIVPVARIVLKLAAGAEGSGGGDAGVQKLFGNAAKGSGCGHAEAGLQISIEPVGYLRAGKDGPVFNKLG